MPPSVCGYGQAPGISTRIGAPADPVSVVHDGPCSTCPRDGGDTRRDVQPYGLRISGSMATAARGKLRKPPMCCAMRSGRWRIACRSRRRARSTARLAVAQCTTDEKGNQRAAGGALGRPEGNAPSGVKREMSAGTMVTKTSATTASAMADNGGMAACVVSRSQ